MRVQRPSVFLRPESSRFLGRAVELARLDGPLRAGKPIAIVGPSGIGKTRLALRYGVSHHHQFAGVWFCDVSDARDVEEMIDLVRRRLAGAATPQALSGPAAAIALERALAARGGALLIVDNLEHLLPDAADTLRGWLRAAPEVKIVVTSRVALGIGEDVVELGALELPRPGHEASDAVDLFIDRVRTHRGSYAPEPDELREIAAIVRKLRGIPLAIELAAARLDDDRSLESLSLDLGGEESSVDRAFGLLAPHERAALCQLSVFRGSFGLAAATRVVEIAGARVEEIVTNLARKSLLQVERHDPLRFSMSESVRSHAATRLSPAAADAVGARHAALFVERAELLAAAKSPPATDDDDRADLVATMAFAARQGDHHRVLQVALALDALARGTGLGRMELAHLDDALGAGATRDLGLVGRALGVRAGALYALGRLDEAKRDAEMAVRLATEVGDLRQVGAMSKIVGEAAFQLGDFSAAVTSLERALAIAKELGDDRIGAAAHYLLGSLHQSRGDRQRARIEFGMSLAIAVHARDAASESRAELGLAWEHLDRGDHASARARYDRAIDLAMPLGLDRTVRIATGYLGIMHFDAGALAEADAHLARAAYDCKRAGDVRVEGIFVGIRGAVLAALGRVDEAKRTFELADELLAKSEFYARVIAIHRGHLEIAEARAASRRGDTATATSLRAAARARIEDARQPGPDGESFVERSDDARLAVRILERSLDR